MAPPPFSWARENPSSSPPTDNGRSARRISAATRCSFCRRARDSPGSSLSAVRCQWAKFFPDGRRILFAGSEPGRGIRLFILDLAGGKPRAITPEGVTIVSQDPFSPDGRSIAAIGPARRIAISPLAPGEPRPVPGLASDDNVIRWSADGHSLYLYNGLARPGIVDL